MKEQNTAEGVALVTNGIVVPGATSGQVFVVGADGVAVPVTANFGLQNSYDVTFNLGGTAHDYTLDSGYVSTTYTEKDTGLDGTQLVSELFGDGVNVPFFYAIGSGQMAGLARTSTGLRITHAAASDAGQGLPAVVRTPQIFMPFAGFDTIIATATVATNAPGQSGSLNIGPEFTLMAKDQESTLATICGALFAVSSPTGVNVYTDVFATSENNNYSASPTGISGGVMTQHVQLVFSRLQAAVYADASISPPTTKRRGKQAITRGIGLKTAGIAFSAGSVSGVTPAAGFWTELQSLRVQGLRGSF